MVFGHLKRQQFHHWPGQLVPGFNHSFSAEIFPNVQPKTPLAQPEAVCSHPVACYLEGETEPYPNIWYLNTPAFKAAEVVDKADFNH